MRTWTRARAAVVVAAVGAGLAWTPLGDSPAGAESTADRRVATRSSTGQATCRGESATAVVHGGEEWTGTPERDVVLVVGNGAEVWGQLGDDLICVYGGAVDRYGHGSRIYGSLGNDTVITYGGDNYVFGNDGDDLIYLNGGVEDAEAGAGNDHVWANGATQSYLLGGAGSDLLVGSPGNDTLRGGDDADVLLGNGGNDNVDGEAGWDELRGGTGFDDLDGGPDSDECIDAQGGASYTACEEITELLGDDLPVAGS